MISHSPQSPVESEREAKDGPPTQRNVRTHGSIDYEEVDRDEASRVPPASRVHPPKKLRKRISRLREKVIGSRLELRERRVDMREQHGLVRSLEAQLLRHWQENNGLIEQDAIGRLHNELCAALDELGPMEQNYDEKEDGLDTLEYDLEAHESRFYKRYTRSDSDESHDSPSMHRSSMSSPSEAIDLVPADHQNFLAPQYLYNARIGEAYAARERLMELDEQKAHYLEIEQDRTALGIPLYQENVDFLSKYPSIYAKHMEELEKIEVDIRQLSGSTHLEETVDYGLLHGVGRHSDVSADFRQKSPFTEPEQAKPLDGTTKESLRRKSEADVWNVPDDPRSSRDRINQWIWERLEHSKMEKVIHKTILNDPEIDEDAWWQLVRQFWQFDRAARSSKNSSRHASGLSTSVRPQELRQSSGSVLGEISNAARRSSSVVNDMFPAGTFAWPEDVRTDHTNGHANGLINQLAYLDLATELLHINKPARGKPASNARVLTDLFDHFINGTFYYPDLL